MIKLLQSSTGEGYSRTWKGLAHGAIPMVVLLAPLFGVNVSVDDLNPLVEAVSVAILSIWSMLAAGEVVFGLVRKLVIRFR